MSEIKKNKLKSLIENKFQNYMYNLDEIIDYNPPKYEPNWNKKFKPKYDGKEWVPDKKKGNFEFRFKVKNPLNLNNDVKGVYLIIGTQIKFFYVGKTDNNFNQRLNSHIQKITATNLEKWTTPKNNWQPFVIKRYEELKEKSVYLNDVKITYYYADDFIEILNNVSDIETELESVIFYYFKKKLNDSLILNSLSQISKKYEDFF